GKWDKREPRELGGRLFAQPGTGRVEMSVLAAADGFAKPCWRDTTTNRSPLWPRNDGRAQIGPHECPRRSRGNRLPRCEAARARCHGGQRHASTADHFRDRRVDHASVWPFLGAYDRTGPPEIPSRAHGRSEVSSSPP